MEQDTQYYGLEPTHRYDDIIDMAYPLDSHDAVKYPPMSRRDRAKIFAPFAALKGYEEAIQEKIKMS